MNITLDPKESKHIVWEDSDEYTVIQDESIGSDRWEDQRYCVIKRNSDGKLFGTHYTVGLTEIQDTSPFEFDTEVVWEELERYEEVLTVVKYRPI